MTFGNATVTGTSFNDPGVIQVSSGATLTLAGSNTITGGLFFVFVSSPQAAPNNSVLFPFILINDLNTDDPTVTLTIQANGTFVPISASGVTFGQIGSVMTITGLLSDINSALAKGVTYTPASTSDTMTLTVTDSSGDSAFRTISINTTNPAAPSFTTISSSGEIDNAGLIAITGTTALNSDQLFNNGTVTVGANDLLQLDGTRVQGGTISDNGTVEIVGLSAVISTNLNIGAGNQLTIDPTARLTISGTTISGGIITNLSSAPGIDVLGSSTINGGAQVNGGSVTIEAGQTLTFGNAAVIGSNATVTGTTFDDPGTIRVASGRTLTLAGTDAITGSILAVSGFRAQVQSGPGTVSLTGLSVGDLNNPGSAVLTLTVRTSSGTLQSTGATSGNNTSQLTFTGTLAAINAALAANAIVYSSLGTASTLTATVTDGLGDTAFKTFSLSATGSIQTTDATGAIRNGGTIDITGTTTLNSDSLFNGGATTQIEPAAALKLEHTGVFGGTITDNGTLEIVGPGRSGLNNLTLNIGTNDLLVVDGGTTTTRATLTLSGTTVNGGTIEDYNASGGGNIDVLGASEIAGTSGSYAQLLGNNVGIVTLDAALTLDYVTLSGITIENGTTFGSGLGPLTIADTVEVAGATTLLGVTATNNGTLQVDNATTLTLSGSTINGGAITVTSGGMLNMTGNDSISGGTLDIHGALNVNGIATISGDAITVESGGIVSIMGTLTIGDATGTGNYQIGTATQNATLEFDGSVGSVGAGATVTFEGANGTLLILQPSNFSTSNVIAAASGLLGPGDVLDLRGFASGSDTVTASTAGAYNSATNTTTLTVSDTTPGNTQTLQFTLQGDYSSSSWTVSSDGSGGFKIVDPPASGTSAQGVGTAGKSINLALANLPAAAGGPITVTVKGMPSDWQVNQGTNLGNDPDKRPDRVDRADRRRLCRCNVAQRNRELG